MSEKSKILIVADTRECSSGNACSDPASLDRREFGRLVASASAGAFLASRTALAAGADSALATGVLTLRTGTSSFTIDGSGSLRAIDMGGRNQVAPSQPAPILSVRVAGELHAPDHATWNPKRDTLTLRFDAVKATALVALHARPTHVTLELTALRTAQPVELVLWGPYPIGIGDLVGEVVGVVRDSESAVGIQALDTKTMGGDASEESDIAPDGLVADDGGTYPGLPLELKKQQQWRGNTAMRTEFGSTLQAYCRNRDKPRVISNWGVDPFVAEPFSDGGVIGSKIALFACPAAQALPAIGAIEVAEGLPHPMMNGQWAKMSPAATASYLIVDFGEHSIDEAIEMTKKAGLKFLYQSSPFETWGHFKLKTELFPRGWDGFRDCVAKAREAGIGAGFHTLSNFITPNDPFVSPVPDPRLARTGSSELTAAIDATETELPVADPIWFKAKTTMNTAIVGEELIQFEAVSADAPWRLLQCRRGAWGTRAAAHSKADSVGKLMDHPYKVFLTNAALSQQVARNIAAFCNYTDAVQLSLDGLEGNWSTGMGQYGCSLFTDAWYEALKPSLRGHIINDASNPHHFTWHIATRYNWGEPWYAGFRQSQTLYRLKNQLFYTRNLIPHMLGWFSLHPETTLEDVEWLCARAAGFDAGFALATSSDSKATQTAGDAAALDKTTAAILDVVCQWETARQSGAFPESLKPLLQDVNRAFRLLSVGPGKWELRQLNPAAQPILIQAHHQPEARGAQRSPCIGGNESTPPAGRPAPLEHSRSAAQYVKFEQSDHPWRDGRVV